MSVRAKTKDLCRGCRDDYYNAAQEGGCWCFAGAGVVEKCFVHLSMVPPWRVDPEATLSCHQRKSYVAVGPEHTNITRNEDHQQQYDGGSYGG